MTGLVEKLMIGVALTGLASALAAQTPQSQLLAQPLAQPVAQQAPDETSQSDSEPSNKAPSDGSSPASVAEAFPDMVSDPTIQGDVEANKPQLVQHWSKENARSLARAISLISAQGLEPADYQPEALNKAIETAPPDELDALASRIFVWLVEDLRDGRTPMEARKQWFIHDPDYLKFPSDRLLAQAVESGDIEATLRQLDPTHADFAALRAELAATPLEQADKRRLIEVNMDRWRWLPRDLGFQYLIVNVPAFELRLMVNDKIISTYRTIVGKPGRTATPQLAEKVEGLIFNPTWTVPQSIVKGEGLGARVLANPAWAKRKGYVAKKGANGWVSVVQQPGPSNALGKVKLDMPNAHAIFLHDTPSRGLFNRDNRALSHGCIRTERALELGITLAILGRGASKDKAVEIATSRQYTKVPIKQEMPVYITYFTMGSDKDGNLQSFKDLYDRDAPVIASFDKPRAKNRAHDTDEEVIEVVDDPRV